MEAIRKSIAESRSNQKEHSEGNRQSNVKNGRNQKEQRKKWREPERAQPKEEANRKSTVKSEGDQKEHS